ncbi:Phosphoserine phosphatase [Streptomyces sp. WMMB 322]|nr:Phosphoserine phosphatase [Streptomyces sp. WMMB 322]
MEISRQLGLDAEIRELELAFAAGGMTPPDFAGRACALWSELTEDHITAAFMGAPWLSGIREVWAEIRERGERSAVISLSPDFFVGRLLHRAPPSRSPELPHAPSTSPGDPAGALRTGARTGGTDDGGAEGGGVDATYGSRWPAVPFRRQPDPAGILSAEAKVRIADELCAEFGVSRNECVAYGDSMSDAALFAAVPVSVAVNADSHVRDLATAEYVGKDLREAYGLVRKSR